MHKVALIGHLGRDPEMRYTQSGQAVTSLTVAANRKYKNAAEELITETIWFRVSVWGKQAEACNQYLKKGRQVYVEGRLNPDKETGGPRLFQRQDGSMGTSFEVTATHVHFLGGGNGGKSAVQGHAENAAAPAEEDIPF